MTQNLTSCQGLVDPERSRNSSVRHHVRPTGERRTVIGCRFIELCRNAERALQRAVTTLETRSLRCAARD